MPLLAPEHFRALFEPLAGQRVGFAALDGNVGDLMSRQATAELFDHFGITWRPLPVTAQGVDGSAEDLDLVVVSGGGNMGRTVYPLPFQQRQRVLALGLPVTIFPQSFITNDEDASPYARVYVRESESRRLDPRFVLAPDLALGLSLPPLADAVQAGVGVFLRRDCEGTFDDDVLSLGDPVEVCSSVEEYIGLAARFEQIVTDRLHFCIAGLLLGREVTLLPNSYFKNRAMYQTWLCDLGCRWRDDARGINWDKEAAERVLAARLAGSPSALLPWSARPIRENGFDLGELDGGLVLRQVDGMHLAECNEAAWIIWQLCDGSRTIEEIARLLGDAHPQTRVDVARDVQTTLRALRDHRAIALDERGSQRAGAARVGGRRNRGKRRPGAAAPAVPVALQVFPPVVRDSRIRLSARLRAPAEPDRTLWYETGAELSPMLSRRADPFVLASLLCAMQQHRPLEVRGAPVSRGLLQNLEEYQRAWTSWRTLLRVIPIVAEEQDDDPGEADKPAIAGFSGGVDSCYTVYRHRVSPDGRHDRTLRAALMVHGFDIPLDEEAQFERALRRSQRILDGLEIELLAVKTNIKNLSFDWLDYHGLVLGSALSLFSGAFGAGIIAGTVPYVMLLPLGSSPVTDRLMGSRRFEIVHHGANVSRLEKVRAVAAWPAAMDNLRVCWQGQAHDRNCGRCLKCVLTRLQLWAVGAQARGFPGPLTPKLVKNALAGSALSRLDWVDIHAVVSEARQRKLTAPWLSILQDKVTTQG